MARPLLVIDIGRDSVRACGLVSGKAEVSVERPIDSDMKAAIGDILKEIESAGLKSFGGVYLGVPADTLVMRKVSVPIKDRKKVEEVLPFELEDNLIREPGDFIFDALPLADGTTLAVAMEKAVLGRYLSVLGELGIEPSWAGSSLFGKERLLKEMNNTGAPAAFMDSESMVISNGKGPLIFKAVTGAHDVKMALAAVEAEGLEVRSFYCAGEAAKALVPPGREVMDTGSSIDERFTGLKALELAIEEGLTDCVNFRKGEFADTGAIERARKGFKTTVALMVLVAVLWGGFVYVRSSRLAGEAAAMKKEVMDSYMRAFPADKTVRAPLYRLEIKLKEQSGDMAIKGLGVDVLGNMKLLASAASGSGVTLYKIAMSGGRVTARGKAPSFEETVKFKSRLLKIKDFEGVSLTDVKTSVSGGVTFSVAVERGGEGKTSRGL